MNILYIVTTYSSRDNNKHYFNYVNGYPYKVLRSILDISKYTKHELTVVVADFASGPKTREQLVNFKTTNNLKNLNFVFGPDASGFLAINKTCKIFNQDYRHDYIFYSVSDATLQNPQNFNSMISDMDKESCSFCYLKIEPGMALPGQKINPVWFNNMSINDCVHHNGICVKSSFAKFYDNRILPDSMDGGWEVLLGYYGAAAGTWRKISSHLEYLHLSRAGLKLRPDRKFAYTNKNLCRQDSWIFPVSPHSNKKNIQSLLRSEHAIKAGIYLEQKYPGVVDKHQPLNKTTRTLMEDFVRNNFLLSEQELSYNDIKVTVL